MKFQLTCCTTVDLDREYFEKRQIPYLCLHFHVDGVSYLDDLGQSMPLDLFYRRIKNEGILPTTSQLNPEEYEEFFEPIVKEGFDILHVTLSSGISGTYNSAEVAARHIAKRYPDRKIIVVDSLCASAGSGLFVDALCDLRDEDKTLEEAAKWAEENKLTVNHWFYSTNLAHYKRGGRISASAANVGTILNICPVMHVDDEGRLIPVKKVIGKKAAAKACLEKMKDNAFGGVNYSGRCFISHSDCYEDAKYLADLIEADFKKLDGRVRIFEIGATIGSHTGNGTVALFFFGNTRN